jgi:putative aldouronate transport system substrate-binding protein
MKKFLSALLALVVTASMVFANGTADGGKAVSVKDPDFVNGRFKTTRNITVEIFDRSNDGGSNPEDNYFTKFIKDGMLRDHNVNVTFKRVPRWTEVEALNNLLAAGDAPDVCVTYSYPTIQQYGNMGGVLDMNPYLTEYKKFLPDMWALLKDTNIYYDQDPVDKHVWALEALLFQNNRTNTFVREDWLKKLNLKEPTTLKEFEAVLKAFKDNAKVLLGDSADKMIPFSIGVDVGWRATELIASFVPNKITDKDMYINGFDDRRLLWPGFKDGIKVLNKWYNEGLIWKDFPLYAFGTKDEDNLIKAGYVGAFIHNWDYPYRDGEQGIHANLKKLVGPEAGYIAVEVFKNDAGKYRKYLSNPVDRKVFFPSTNKEPLASLLYVNWLSKFENRKYLQIGDKDVHHVVMPDGAIKVQPVKGEKIMNSGTNLDYTIIINGLDLGDPVLSAKSLALGYAGVDSRYVEKAKATQLRDARISPHFNVGEITSENGMDAPLKEKRNNFLVQSIVAKPAEFDGIFDKGMKDWLASGGQAITDERRAKFEAAFGKK